MCVWQNHESSSGTCAPDRQCFDVDIFSEEDPWFLEVHRNTLLLADIEKKTKTETSVSYEVSEGQRPIPRCRLH